MDLSLNSISAGAMAAATSLGSSFQAIGSSAAVATGQMSNVVAGGVNSMAQGASLAVQTLPVAVPGAVNATAAGTAQLATNLSVVEKPVRAIAAGVPRAPLMVRTAGFLSRVLPIVAITASGLSGARIVSDRGAQALVTSKDGRGAVLGAVGGALLLVPHPATQLAAAGVLGVVAANHFGALDKLDGARLDRLPRLG